MSPRTAAEFEAIRDERREQLLESALTLFARHGYANTSIRMIAREADVSQGLLYNYFASKEELLHAIFARSMQDVEESFAEARSGTTPHQQLENLVRASLRIVQRDERFWRLSYGLRFQTEVLAGLGSAIQEWSDAIRNELEHLLRSAGIGRPEIEARVLFALIDGMAQHYILDPENYPVEDTITAVLSRYRNVPNAAER